MAGAERTTSACFLQGDACRPPGPALEGNSETGCWSPTAGTGLPYRGGRVGSGDSREEEQARANEGAGCGPLATLAMGHLVGLGGTEERAVGVLGGCPCALVGEEMRWHQKWVAELCGRAGPSGRSPWKGMRRLLEGAFCPTQDDVGPRAL